MDGLEEKFAVDFYERLCRALVERSMDAKVEVSGAGVHWNCTATLGQRACRVSCFDVGGAAEYLACYAMRTDPAAWGRTRDANSAVASVIDWINEATVAELGLRFDFVDKKKRFLQCIANHAMANVPGLWFACRSESRDDICAQLDPLFRSKSRSVRVWQSGPLPNTTTYAAFEWDGCALFRIVLDFEPKNRSWLLANWLTSTVLKLFSKHSHNMAGPRFDQSQWESLLKRWLVDVAMPSELTAEYPSVQFSEVAPFYEAGNPIEGEFFSSWNFIEQFYADFYGRISGTSKILALIKQIRRAGFDRTLRAGQSMSTLVVSRSRRHGMRDGQHCIGFWFGEDGMTVHCHFDERAELSFDRIELTPEVNALLTVLASRAID